MARLRFQLPLTSDEELRLYLLHAFGVTLPSVSVCQGHSNPFRAVSDAYYARSPVLVIKGSRGLAGKTMALGALAAAEASTLRADVTVLGGSGEQSRRVLAASARMWAHESAPRSLLRGDVARETRFRWGNSILALTASQRSVRGPHPQRLRLDEVDEMDVAILDAALGQPMSSGGVPTQVVISSTHQYADGTMTEVLKRAADRGWPVHEWCLRETLMPNGWLSPDEVALKKAQMSTEMWRTEVELGEPSIGDRAIDGDKLRLVFDRSLGEFEGDNEELIVVEEPKPGASYVTGVDWARKVDWTVIDTWRVDCVPFRRVAWERCGRLPWPALVEKLDRRAKTYRTDSQSGDDAAERTWHDATGIGDVVDNYLSFVARGVQLVGRTRSELFSRYIVGLEHLELVSPLIRFVERNHRYATRDDLYGSGHPPDDFVAASLAYAAARARVEAREVELVPAPLVIERQSPWPT